MLVARERRGDVQPDLRVGPAVLGEIGEPVPDDVLDARCRRSSRQSTSSARRRGDVRDLARERAPPRRRRSPAPADCRRRRSNATSRRHGMRSSPRRASTMTRFLHQLAVGDDDRLAVVGRDRHVAPADADDLARSRCRSGSSRRSGTCCRAAARCRPTGCRASPAARTRATPVTTADVVTIPAEVDADARSSARTRRRPAPAPSALRPGSAAPRPCASSRLEHEHHGDPRRRRTATIASSALAQRCRRTVRSPSAAPKRSTQHEARERRRP